MALDDELYERVEWLEDDIEELHDIVTELPTYEDLETVNSSLTNMATRQDLEKVKGDLTWRFIILVMSFIFGVAAIVAAVFTVLAYFSG